MYSDNFMPQRYTMYQSSANLNTKCAVEFFGVAGILGGMKWYEKAKRLMKAEKIKQDQLLTVFNVATRGAVGHYLTGRRQPDPMQMKSLAEKLGCSLDDLLSDDDNVDAAQAQIRQVMRAVSDAMSLSGRKFTDAERMSIYRVGFAAGLDLNITQAQLTEYIKTFVGI